MDRVNGNNTVDIGDGRRGFRSQNAAAGIAGTEVTDKILNDVQEEICAVIENSGLTLDPQNQQQLWEALQSIAAPGFANRSAWLPVLSLTTTAPPNSATLGDAYIIPAGATGVWAGNQQKLAEWNGSSWRIVTTKDGHGVSLPDGRVFEKVGGTYSEKIAIDAQSGKWNFVQAGGTPDDIVGSLNPPITVYPTGLEVQVKISSTNTGPVTLNLGGGAKSVTTPSGSPLQSTDLSGGGVYSFIYNGTNWIVLLEGQRVLDGDITLYVRSDGSDSNDGMVNTAARAFQTIQAAVTAAQRRYVSTGYSVTIRVSTGAYEPFRVVGSGTIINIIGDEAAPGNCTIASPDGAAPVSASRGATINVSGLALSNVSGSLLLSQDRSSIGIGKCRLGISGIYQIYVLQNSTVTLTDDIEVVGGARSLAVASSSAVFNGGSKKITFVGAVNYSTATFWGNNGTLTVSGMTFGNPANVSGKRYQADVNGLIWTAGAGANFLPGSAAGTIGTGGQYL